MDTSLYLRCSWEYLPDKNDTYVTYIIHMLSFFFWEHTNNDNFQGQTLIQSMLLAATPVRKIKGSRLFFPCFIRQSCIRIQTCTLSVKIPATTVSSFDSCSSVWVTSCSTKEHILREPQLFLNKMFAWVWLCILQSRNSAQSVNPGTLCDGGVLRAQHSPWQDRLLFSPVMSILLGISASLHTTCCAQQRGEAGAGRVVVSACQSQSQGSVNSHHSEKLCPDVTCLQTPHSFFFSPLDAVLFFFFTEAVYVYS